LRYHLLGVSWDVRTGPPATGGGRRFGPPGGQHATLAITLERAMNIARARTPGEPADGIPNGSAGPRRGRSAGGRGALDGHPYDAAPRSEERRVGKEGRH